MGNMFVFYLGGGYLLYPPKGNAKAVPESREGPLDSLSILLLSLMNENLSINFDAVFNPKNLGKNLYCAGKP